MLSFTLLGQVLLSKNGSPVTRFRSQKEVALLTYLAQTNHPHTREFLADLLWESSSHQQGLTNLRTALARLRKKVGDVLQVTRKTIALSPTAELQVDSVALLTAVAALEQIETAEQAANLQNALAVYQGDFMANFHLPNASNFNQWMMAARENIRRQVLTAYGKLGQYARTSADFELGITTARRWLEVDNLDESAHTLLIQMLLNAGQRREAKAHYNHSVALLQAELGVQPPEKMTELVEAVHSRRSPTSQPTRIIRHNLPAAHDQFFGRKAVIDEIHVRLDQPWCRLITLTGPGGVGKTRLVKEIARSRLSQYPDGVWLVKLAELDPFDDDIAEAIAVEIATELDLRLTGSKKPVNQLIDHLQHKQMLLVLDNFEHLLGGVQTVLDIVERCETLQTLVTSREALQLRAEWTMALTGLSYPLSERDETSSAAVQLFAARHAQQGHGAIEADELAAMRLICRLVEGLPLAIELAAALTRNASCRAVAERVENGFGVLASSLRDMPLRHQSLLVVFEMSWETLPPILKQIMAKLSVFRGGFTAVAARTIVDATPEHLAALGDKSLLTYDEATDRYALHAVVREFAARKRDASDTTLSTHAHYFLTQLAHHTEPLQKEAPQVSIEQIQPEIDNVRRAWQTGMDEQLTQLLFDALTPLSIFYQLRGLSYEGEAVMQTTLRTALTWQTEGAALATHAGLELARYQNRLGHYQAAIQTVKATIERAKQCENRWAEGMGYVWWGESLWRLGKYKLAEAKLNHALDIAKTMDSTLILAWYHHHLGIINDFQSRYEAAYEHLEKACAGWRILKDSNKLSVSLNSIGLVYRNQGNLNAAKETMEQALAICTEQENRYLQAMLLNNLSSIHIMQQDHFGAEYYLQLGLELAKASNSLHSQSDIYINLGENYRFQGENELAAQNLERGLKIAERIGNRPSIAEALCRLADVKRTQQDMDGAKLLYNQALEITQQDNLKSLELEALIGLAMLCNDNDAVKAKHYGQRAIKLANRIGNPDLLERVERVHRTLSLK